MKSLVKHENFSANLTMLISSILSLVASLVLSIEAVRLAADSGAKLSCNLSAVISCGKVASSWQSNLLGFPNPFIGLICEAVVITIAVSGLLGIKYPKAFYKVALFFYGAGLVFALWLLTQSYFVIKAFCPWCLLVTFSTITVFASMLKISLKERAFTFSKNLNEKIDNFYERGLDIALLSVIYAFLIIAIIAKYHSALF